MPYISVEVNIFQSVYEMKRSKEEDLTEPRPKRTRLV